MVFKIIPKDVFGFKNACVIGKQAKDDADQKLFKLMDVISRRFDGVMEMADKFGSFDVDRVLILEAALLTPQDEAEFFDMFGEVLKGEGGFFVGVEVDKFEGLEVADKDMLGHFRVFECVCII